MRSQAIRFANGKPRLLLKTLHSGRNVRRTFFRIRDRVFFRHALIKDPSSPGGSYAFDISVAYERSIAAELLRFANGSKLGVSIVSVELDGKAIEIERMGKVDVDDKHLLAARDEERKVIVVHTYMVLIY